MAGLFPHPQLLRWRPAACHTCLGRCAATAVWCVCAGQPTCSPAVPAGADALPPAEVEQMIGTEVRTRLAGRVRWEHVSAYEVLQDPFRWALHACAAGTCLGLLTC